MQSCFSVCGKLVFVAACLSLLAAAEGRGEEQTPADADDQRILGSWKSTRFERDGKSDPMGAGGKAIFTPGRAFIHGIPDDVKLDASQSPRHFDQGPNKGIYEIRGEWLRVCLSMSSSDPRPTEFKTAAGDGRQIIIFKRLAAIDPAAPDVDFDASLRKTITTAIAAMEAGDIESLLKTIVPPDALAQMPAAMRQQMNKHVSGQKDAMLKTFRVLPKIEPQMNEAGDQATFDLTNCHIDGGLYFAEVKFAKNGDAWHLLLDQ